MCKRVIAGTCLNMSALPVNALSDVSLFTITVGHFL